MTKKSGKVIRDGKVAVLYSPGFGAGWYTWNTDYPQCLYQPEIVALVEAKDFEAIPETAKRIFGPEFYAGGSDELEIVWLNQGQKFRIDEYDGNERLVAEDDRNLRA